MKLKIHRIFSLFQWLIEFIKFINEWKAETDQIPDLSQDLKSRLCISYQTIEGIRMTGIFLSFSHKNIC